MTIRWHSSCESGKVSEDGLGIFVQLRDLFAYDVADAVFGLPMPL